MKWKIILLISLIALLTGLLLFRTPKFPTFPSITGLFYKILSSQKLTNFNLYIDSIKTPQTFNLLNTTFIVDGICLTPINMGKVSIQLANLPCKIEMYSPFGIIKVVGKNIYVEATSPLIRINGIDYISSDKVVFELSVNSLQTNVFAQSLSFRGFKGRFEKLLDNAISTIVHFPPCEGIELLDFSGALTIEEETVITGSARVSYWCENVKIKV